MQTYIVIVSGSIINASTVHLNGIWHLIWRYLSKPVLGGHPVLSGHYSILRGCPLNTGFTVFRFVCIKLFSLIWFLQIWVAIYVYGTMINWSTLIKKLMQTYIVIVSGSILNVSTVHLNGIWHLIWRYLSKPLFGGPCIKSGHYSIPQGCPLNRS